MDAMRILMDEHQSLAAIIHAIRHMIGEIGAGRLQPDHKLLEAMVHYLDAYPEKRHHPKEDAFLFGPLRARTHDATPRSTASRPSTPRPTPASRCSRPRSRATRRTPPAASRPSRPPSTTTPPSTATT
jgi:hypothetical protein